jgi:D-alanyl-D-alanine carboxypeptidase
MPPDQSPGAMEGYRARIAGTHADLGIPAGAMDARGLPLCAEAGDLVVAETEESGKQHLLAPDAAAAWQALKDAARRDGVVLEIASAFRSFDRQVEIVRRKLGEGTGIDAILCEVAPPGFSEHHTGRAIDINTPGCEAFEEAFEQTAAFDWLQMNARRFGFFLSYPRGNACGYIYEPWHWCYRQEQAPGALAQI